jgi:hypothetical protein
MPRTRMHRSVGRPDWVKQQIGLALRELRISTIVNISGFFSSAFLIFKFSQILFEHLHLLGCFFAQAGFRVAFDDACKHW